MGFSLGGALSGGLAGFQAGGWPGAIAGGAIGGFAGGDDSDSGGTDWGALGSSALSFMGGERRNSANIASAREQMEFQRYMSNTSYRRAMNDMRKAGLNPILAGKLGGASTPGGAMPVLYDSITPAVNTGLQAMQTKADVGVKESQTEINQEQVEKVAQEVKNLEAGQALTEKQTEQVAETVLLLRQQIETEFQRTRTQFQEAGLKNEQREAARYENVQNEILADFYNSADMARLAKEFGISPNTLGGIVKFFFGGKQQRSQ